MAPGWPQSSVFRCTNSLGQVSYQEQACRPDGAGASQRQVPLLPNPAPASAANAPIVAPKPVPKPVSPPADTVVRVAALTFYYDTTNEPMEHPSAQVEAQIHRALNAWMSGCNVTLRYGGRAPYSAAGTPDRVSVRWMPEYLYARHPAHDGAGIAGTGSLRAGISLTTRISEESLQSTLVHELGHVLGLPHFHEDAQSVMSYLRDDETRQRATPSASDYLACNLSMKRMFGIAFDPPVGVAKPAPPAMSDHDALQKKLGVSR